MDGITALDVEDETEVLAGLVDLHNIHESSGELGIGTDFAVNLDEPLLQDGLDLLAGQSVLETISQENSQRHGFTTTVRSRVGASSVHTTQLVQHPGLGRCQALHMFLWPSNHFEAVIQIKLGICLETKTESNSVKSQKYSKS